MRSLLQQVPADVAAESAGLQAATAAMSKAVEMVQQSEFTLGKLPELLMAWFYAGYHCGQTAQKASNRDEA
jgi:hypothetical protein